MFHSIYPACYTSFNNYQGKTMNLTMLDGVEKQLEEWYKGMPKLPKNVSKWIAKYAWVFVLVGAVLMTFASLSLLAALGILSTATVYGSVHYNYGFFGWIALAALVVYVIFSFKAVSPLKAMKAEGWKLLFYLEFFYMAFGLMQWLARPAAVGNLFGPILGAAIGFYFLFQIKEYYK